MEGSIIGLPPLSPGHSAIQKELEGIGEGQRAYSEPSAMISGNLADIYHHNDQVEGITAYCSDPNASFEWRVTTPDVIGYIYEGATIPKFKFDLTGEYIFQVKITPSGEDSWPIYRDRRVFVYPNADALNKSYFQNFALRDALKIYFDDPNTPPPAVIDFFADDFRKNDQVEGITAYCADPNASFEWEVTAPDGAVYTYEGDTIPKFKFDLTGEYHFQVKIDHTKKNNDPIYLSRYVTVDPEAPLL